jgi:outer membrane protein TolC
MVCFPLSPRALGAGLLFLSALLNCQAAQAQALTLVQAQQRALQRSRQLPAQDALIVAASERAIAAGQRPDPVLKAGIDNLPVSGPDRYSLGADFMTMRRIGLMQEWTRSDKLRLRALQFEKGADKARAEKALLVSRVERETALAWLELFYADRATALAVELQQQAGLAVQAAEAGYRGGKSSQAELLAARSALAMADDRHAELLQRQQNARVMLTRWTGEDGAGAGSSPMLVGAPDIDHLALDPATLETALAHHPEVAVLERQRDLASVQAELSRADRKPDWTVEVALQQRGGAYSNMVSVGLSVPLQWNRARRQDRELSAQLAQVEQAQDERDELLRTHLAETRVLLDAWQSGRARLRRYREQVLPLAEQRGSAALAAYRGGKASLAEVVSARTAGFDARMQALALEAATANTWAQLNFLAPTDAGMSMLASETAGQGRAGK